MTDTGQIPGEGLPENAGMVEQPGVPAPGAYTFLENSENSPEEDDLLLMPGAQGAWSEAQHAAASHAAHTQPAPPAVDQYAAAPGSVQTAAQQEIQPQHRSGEYQVEYGAGHQAHDYGSAPAVHGLGQPAAEGVPMDVAFQEQHVPGAASAPVPEFVEVASAPGGALRTQEQQFHDAGAAGGQTAFGAPEFQQDQNQDQDQGGQPPAQVQGTMSVVPGVAAAAPASAVAAGADPAAVAQGAVQEPGAHEAGVHEAGAHEAGAHEAGAHEAGGRDSGAVDLGAVRTPAAATSAMATPPPARRPLHMGPPVPEASNGVVRSLADRGPAGTPPHPMVVRGTPPQPATTTGVEYLDVARDEPAAQLPGPQLGEIPPQAGAPWDPHPPQEQTVAPAETVVPAGRPDTEATVPAPRAGGSEQQPAVPDGTGPEGAEHEAAPVPAAADVPEATATAADAAPAEDVTVPQDATPPQQPGNPAPTPAAPEAHDAVAAAEPVNPDPDPAAVPTAEAAEAIPPTHPDGLASTDASTGTPADAASDAPTDVPPADPVGPESPEAGPAAAPDTDGPADEAAPEPQPTAVPAAVAAETAAATEAAEPSAESTTESADVQSQEAAPAAEPATPVPTDQAAAADQVDAAASRTQPVAAEAAEGPAPEPAAGGDFAPAGPDAHAEAAPTPEPAGPADAPGPAAAAPEPAADPQTATGSPADAATPDTPADAPTPADADADADAEPTGPAATPPAPGYDDAEREAVLRVMRERRDIRNGFRGDPIPHEVLLRVLEAAHTAPSVGHSQPWDFVVIRSAETRRTMHELAQRQREAYAKSLPKGRAKQFKELKIEAILDTPVNIVVTADPTRGGRHTLGRHTQPQMAPYSSALAVENLWLAARAEGLGVGWVSFFDEREMVRTLGLPEHLEVVAYLCVGYVDEFPDEPELMQAGWSKRRPLSWVVHEETYGRRALPGEQPHDLLQETITNIRPLDAKALGEAWERQKRMTKPSGALGMLEIISAQLSGLSRMCPPPIPEPAAVAIFAGDHGVHAQGVTAWPQEVTGQMVANFLGGGAVCNAFANQVGAEVCVIDVGVASDLPATPGLLPRKVRPGTADFTTGPALSREDVLSAIEVGIETARDLVAAGNKALLTGEMGIANTTASAALISVYTGADPSEITGRGTGINDEMHARKVDVVRRALELHQPDPADPIGVLSAVGGLEHCALVGLILGGASLRTPVILDGVSTGAAALVARAIAPESLAACIAGHRSAEPGHVAALNKLGLRPLVDLDLRLGEGTGALLALPVVQSAARAMHEVATFDSAGVTEK
ncbi:nicotinate-nucleotide--dimethylbenzimidazole phosphoribosyltransferase [Streptomyces sp. NPDC003023]|uniref:nicotinate-nucleotide--dimethylbenzimidazole phosphoribosyltransferase n=1 Tax=Streptomyces sp. NPDC003023 TaxID=3364675 RepID=UPI003685EB9E